MQISLHPSRARRLSAALTGCALLAGTVAGAPAGAAPSAVAARTLTATETCGEGDGLPDSKISIQLFTHVNEIGWGLPSPDTLDRVLGEVANAGFSNIELFNQPYQMPVDEHRAILDKHGLEVSSSHGSTDWNTWPDTVAYAVALGQDYIGTGGMAGSYGTYEEAVATAAYVNQLGQYAHENGANKIVLHNHQTEFTTQYPHPETGEMVSAWQVIEENTDPRYVSFELDVGWAADAGIDVPAWIEEYGNRIELLHVKDAVNINAAGDPRQVALGSGELDLPAIITAAEPYVKYYTYEWDYAPSFESSAESYHYLRCFLSEDDGGGGDEDGESLALRRPVTTSSVDEPDQTGEMAVDGNAGTRWGSEHSEPEWIAVDLGANYDLNRVVIDWETAYASGYEIQTSLDGDTWTTVHTVTDGDGLFDDLDVSGTGRHVRLYLNERATGWGFSLYEVEIYGTPSGGEPSDTTAPLVEAEVTGDTTKTVTITATDDSGRATIEYQIDDATTWTTYSAPLTLDEPGTHVVRYRATDAAGNRSTGQVEVVVRADEPDPDPEAGAKPTVSVTTMPAASNGRSNWFTTPVTVRLAADGGESLAVEYRINNSAWTAYTEPFQVTGDGITRVQARATDGGGRTSTIETTTIKMDAAEPTVVVKGIANGGKLDIAAVRTARVSVTDVTSGPAQQVVRLDGKIVDAPARIDAMSLRPGRHRLEVTAFDEAGNQASLTIRFRALAPSYGKAHKLLDRLDDEGAIGPKLGKKLTNQLDAARRTDGRNDARGALRSLKRFAKLTKRVDDKEVRLALKRLSRTLKSQL
jgi:sugar phosphate isomerase/epimerase